MGGGSEFFGSSVDSMDFREIIRLPISCPFATSTFQSKQHSTDYNTPSSVHKKERNGSIVMAMELGRGCFSVLRYSLDDQGGKDDDDRASDDYSKRPSSSWSLSLLDFWVDNYLRSCSGPPGIDFANTLPEVFNLFHEIIITHSIWSRCRMSTGDIRELF